MPSIALQSGEIVVGVDTHKDEHVAVVLDGLGGVIDDGRSFPATPTGYADLVNWACDLGEVHSFGVEGCGSYGSGLARFLRRHEYVVREVTRPPRKGKRRLSGKSDPIDAEHAARVVLSGTGTTTPKLADGIIEAIRIIKIARDTAVKNHSATMITLKAVLVTASDSLRGALGSLTSPKLAAACAELSSDGDIADHDLAMRYTLAALADRWIRLGVEIATHTAYLEKLTQTAAPQLVDRFGVGFDSAAQMLIAAGDNPDRIRSEAAFAKLCGACPIPASSGKTGGRHRLNRGGNRQANAALYRVVIVRMRWHPKTIAYVERRTADGLSKKDIIRCLKRYVARELFQFLPMPDRTTPRNAIDPESLPQAA